MVENKEEEEVEEEAFELTATMDLDEFNDEALEENSQESVKEWFHFTIQSSRNILFIVSSSFQS